MRPWSGSTVRHVLRAITGSIRATYPPEDFGVVTPPQRWSHDAKTGGSGVGGDAVGSDEYGGAALGGHDPVVLVPVVVLAAGGDEHRAQECGEPGVVERGLP